MICRVGEETHVGQAVDLPADLDPEAVAAAVREGRAEADGTVVTVEACEAGSLHERVGCITPSVSIRPRTALAVAARSRGWSTPVDGRLARAKERLAAHEAEDEGGDAGESDHVVDETDHRRRLAETSAEIDRLRERVAEARGRVRATGDDAATARNGDGPPGSVEEAVRSLSEVETAAAAARERHRRARTRNRAARDRLQERLRLADEVANAERAARAHLVERARGAYESALSAVPGVDAPSAPFETRPDAMALAVARVGDLAAPVVIACGRFEDAAAAARWLDASAIRLEP